MHELTEAESSGKNRRAHNRFETLSVRIFNINALPHELQREVFARFCLDIRYGRTNRTIEI